MKLARQDLHQLSGAYAVDALDAAERDRFERHLRRCQSCAHEVRGLQATATGLGLAAARPAPEQMRGQVLIRAARTRQLPPVTDGRRQPQQRSRWMPRLAVAMAAVVMAAVIALGITLAATHRQLNEARARQAEIAAVLNAPGAQIVTTRSKTGGTATAVVSWRLRKGILTLAGLPALPASKIYQLWVIGPKLTKIRSAGLADGTASAPPVLAAGLQRGDVIGVTVEPAGGTRQPTMAPFVELKLPV